MAVWLWGQLALVYRGLTLKRRSLGRKRLAAIVPIVIYTGRRRWTVCRELSDMIEDDGTRRPLQLSYELLDAWRAGSQPAGDNFAVAPVPIGARRGASGLAGVDQGRCGDA